MKIVKKKDWPEKKNELKKKKKRTVK